MNLKASIAAAVLGLVVGAGCASGDTPPKTTGGGVVETTTTTGAIQKPTATSETTATTAAAVSYANCDAVRAAGKAPLHKGDPGYSTKLDRDGDGTACDN